MTGYTGKRKIVQENPSERFFLWCLVEPVERKKGFQPEGFRAAMVGAGAKVVPGG